jgi:hypothetical protein
VLQIGDVRVMIVFMEFKHALGKGGSDPSHQVGLSMKHSWLEKSGSRSYTCLHLSFLIVLHRDGRSVRNPVARRSYLLGAVHG